MHDRGDTDLVNAPPAVTADATTPSSPPQVEYARSHFQVSRRQWRGLMALTLLNTIMLGWFVIGPQSTQFVQSQWQQFQAKRAEKAKLRQMLTDQQACLDYTMPADLVVYEQRPEEAKRLLSDRAGYEPVDIRSDHRSAPWPALALHKAVPAAWTSYATALNARRITFGDGHGVGSSNLAFLGGRATPSGARRLIVVDVQAATDLSRFEFRVDRAHLSSSLLLTACAFEPATETTPPRPVNKFRLHLKLPTSALNASGDNTRWVLHEAQFVTLLVGQPDPNDPSHFVLPLRLNGQSDAIDGWVQEDGVLLKPRRGTPTQAGWGSDRGWILPAHGPAPPPMREAASQTPAF